MQILDVYLDGQARPAGVLVKLDNGSTGFQYGDDYAGTDRAIPLSLSLPVGPHAFGDVETRSFFVNLLPENQDLLRRVIDQYGIDAGDYVGLLAHLGADCPGAISCVPHGEGPVKNPGVFATDYDAINQETISDFVRRMANGQALPDEVRDPSPVAGYQQKMALTRLPEGGFALPRTGAGAPTTHILKTPRVADRRDAELERAAALLARHAGLDVVVPETPTFAGHPTILVERYDRATANGVVRRLHQEDFAQALGLPASLKYERRGTPQRSFNAAAVFNLLQRTSAPITAIRSFLKLTIFNACVGNADNHAKNHSLLYRSGPAPELAPAYDLLPTRLNPQLIAEMGFRIGEAKAAEDIDVDDLALLFHTFGFGAAAAVRFVETELAPIMLAIDRAAANRRDIPKDLDDMIGGNLETLSEACGLVLPLRERDAYQAIGGGWQAGS